MSERASQGRLRPEERNERGDERLREERRV